MRPVDSGLSIGRVQISCTKTTRMCGSGFRFEYCILLGRTEESSSCNHCKFNDWHQVIGHEENVFSHPFRNGMTPVVDDDLIASSQFFSRPNRKLSGIGGRGISDNESWLSGILSPSTLACTHREIERRI